ncbi:MAG TPA: S9 family peptidase [Gemmatimonadaceae bacterium]|nr:S9 family peptidase [Gemmatimonadaceae bacterium]
MSRHAFRAFAIAFTLFATAGHAQSRGRALTVEDYYRVKSIGGVAMSRDARWVAFTVSTRVESTNGNKGEVWLVPFDGSAPARRVGPDTGSATGPSWQQDGTLRFTASGRIIVIDPRTPDVMGIAGASEAGGGRGGEGRGGGGRGGGRGGGGGGNARVPSPDGQLVAMLRDTPVARRDVFPPLTEFEKRHEERFKGVTFDWMDFHRDGAPFPTPNAKDPLINPPQEIVVASANGSNERAITRLGVRPTGIQWLRDGSALIFSADSAYRDELVYGRTDVWSVAKDGTGLRRLTNNNELDYNGARLSPDGNWILCSRGTTRDAVIAKKMDNGGPVDLVLIPATGGAERVLTADWDYLPTAALWSPDSKYIYFQGGVGGSTHLFRVATAGGAVQQLTTGQRDVASLSISEDFTKIVYMVGRFEAPSEVYSANIDGSNEKQLTRVHDAFTSEVELSKSERLLFKSADGTDIEGWLLFPHNYSATSGPYPLIVSSHGGPHAAVNYGFNFKNQYFAANGYFVLEVNFRSSTGYGEKFLWGTWGAWGTKDGQDVIAGMDFAMSKHPIDRRRVASIGHSYGGFMTNWLITQYPERFAAAASGAGIVNWTSDYANSDIPVTKEMEFWGAPWDDRARETMIKQSPLTYANRAKAATLFINGEIDQRVPYSENQQLYVALKKNGVPAKMIQYADQPHGIAGSWNAVHRMLNERRWFDLYLKGKSAQ